MVPVVAYVRVSRVAGSGTPLPTLRSAFTRTFSTAPSSGPALGCVVSHTRRARSRLPLVCGRVAPGIFSKHSEGRFPEEDEILGQLS